MLYRYILLTCTCRCSIRYTCISLLHALCVCVCVVCVHIIKEAFILMYIHFILVLYIAELVIYLNSLSLFFYLAMKAQAEGNSTAKTLCII